VGVRLLQLAALVVIGTVVLKAGSATHSGRLFTPSVLSSTSAEGVLPGNLLHIAAPYRMQCTQQYEYSSYTSSS
jgi:hypothetical protein